MLRSFLAFTLCATRAPDQRSLRLKTRLHAEPPLYTVAKIFAPMAWLQGQDRFPSGAAIFVSDCKAGSARWFRISQPRQIPSFRLTARRCCSREERERAIHGRSGNSILPGERHAGLPRCPRIASGRSIFPMIASFTRERLPEDSSSRPRNLRRQASRPDSHPVQLFADGCAA